MPLLSARPSSNAASSQHTARVAKRLATVALFAIVATSGLVPGGVSTLTAEPPVRAPLSPRNANYTIEARLEPDTKILTARQTVTWRNIQSVPTNELWFHLYWNGWRNDQSTWMREDRIRGRSDRGTDVKDEDWAFLEVDSIRLGGDAGFDLMPTRRYAAPDDGNADDRTVMVVTLPRPVAPGETIEVELDWRAKIPRTFARTGHRNDFYFIAHWYPAIGVFEGEDGWNAHQFHAATEFFADYGVYDVALDLPAELIVGATGRVVETTDLGDGFVRHRYREADVHNFTWTASPHYIVVEDRFEVDGLPPVDIRLLIQPEHLHQAERHIHATQATLEHYGRWYGAYPYPQVTVVDPAYRSGAGGMEYPTIFTSGTRVVNPIGGGSPEGVTIHEAGHQFWYGVVGNNEFEDAWLDEGLNTFSTARAVDVTYGPSKQMASYVRAPGRRGGAFRVLLDDFERSRAIYGSRFARFIGSDGPTMDAMHVPTWAAYPAGAGTLSYHKTAMWLHTLERWLGWDVLQPAMASFYRQYAFGHPTPEDFFRVLEEETGRDLDPFFEQVYRRDVHFDYRLARATSRPAKVRGFEEDTFGRPVMPSKDDKANADEDEKTIYRSEIVIRRLGGGIFPVDVEMIFEDGSTWRETWDGEARWKQFVVERPSKLASATVDPDRVLLLDVDYANNSRVMESESRFVARKWSSKWMVFVQDLLNTFTFYL